MKTLNEMSIPEVKVRLQEWREQMFVYSCYLYEEEDDPVLSDAHYDALCQDLLRDYRSASEAFRDRVPRAQLTTGTASGMTYSAAEIAAAQAWRERVRG